MTKRFLIREIYRRITITTAAIASVNTKQDPPPPSSRIFRSLLNRGWSLGRSRGGLGGRGPLFEPRPPGPLLVCFDGPGMLVIFTSYIKFKQNNNYNHQKTVPPSQNTQHQE